VTRRRPGPDQGSGPRTSERGPSAIDYRSLAERAPAILYRYRLVPSAEMEYVNAAVTQTLGYTPEDFYADPELVLAVLDVPALSVAAEADPGVSGRPTIRRWRRRDGTYADVEDRTIAIRDRNGNVEAIEGVARDVSAELATQHELRASRDRLHAVLAHVPVILWATDREGRLTVLEGAGLHGLAVRPEDMLGRTPAEIHPDTRRYRRHLTLALRGRIQSVDVQLGEQTFMTRLGPLVDVDGTIAGVTGVSVDVTQERRLVEALASEGRQRATVAAALDRFDPSLDLDSLSEQIATEMLLLDGVDHAGIIAFGPGILTYFISFVGAGLPMEAGRALPPARSVYLREQAEKGPWVERWTPRAVDGRYGLSLEEAGLRAAAYVPLRRGTAPWGLLAAGSRQTNGPELLERRMSTLVEFALNPEPGRRRPAGTGPDHGTGSVLARLPADRSSVGSIAHRVRGAHPLPRWQPAGPSVCRGRISGHEPSARGRDADHGSQVVARHPGRDGPDTQCLAGPAGGGPASEASA